ncbi:MAG: aa3-type cytochrome oxidase subunit IV [Chloroflexota bacterium]
MSRGSGPALNGPAELETEARPESAEREHIETSAHPEGMPGEHEASEHSIWPVVLSIGLLLLAMGLLNHIVLAAVGAIVVLVAIVGWLWQPWVSA